MLNTVAEKIDENQIWTRLAHFLDWLGYSDSHHIARVSSKDKDQAAHLQTEISLCKVLCK